MAVDVPDVGEYMTQVKDKYYPKNLFFHWCGYYRRKHQIDRLRGNLPTSGLKTGRKVSLESGRYLRAGERYYTVVKS